MASTENQSLNKEDDNACLYAMHLSTSHIFPMALTAAIELNLFDIIASRANRDAYMSPSEIASQLPTKNPNAPFLLDRMLRFLATYSLLTCSVRTCEDGRVERLYGLSPAGKFFAQNEDGGLLSSMTLLNSHPNVAEVWYVRICMQLLNIALFNKNRKILISHSISPLNLFWHSFCNYRRHLKDAILEEGNLYEKVCGTANIFKYMEADPALNKIFNKAMADISGISMRKILEAYKGFEGVSLLVDVGGCSGADLNTIISKYPSIRGINFDLPHMIQHAPSYPGTTIHLTAIPMSPFNSRLI